MRYSLPILSSAAATKRPFITASTLTTSFLISFMGSLISLAPAQPQRYQSVVVMRHGERMDNFVESWLSKAARPWDPPLFDDGHSRSFRTGMELRTQLGYPIHRVIVSPFLRCVETASEVASALCAIDENSDAVSGTDVPIDPSKIKASIEYGLCEMFNNVAIRTPPENKDQWGFKLPEIQSKLQAGTVDPEYEPVFQKLPKWGETSSDARARYERVIHALADKYPSENLLLITHGEGLRATVSTFLNGTKIRKVEYCAYVKLQRQVTPKEDNTFTAGKFDVVSHHGYLLRNDDA
ncbi:uncharacterized protein LOC116205166 [Punica granatum]|uniref:Uncharacterized protein LOC116205166 n=1 Tax=Punica granatum TaxID=22663 RepID=A0A218VY02_PUNGR|nr:uncharacterized protein LOC116205166 [Punica granatum]OWM64881.1 hypothetical protein CDL15_Pgr028598 [Punica granatum]